MNAGSLTITGGTLSGMTMTAGSGATSSTDNSASVVGGVDTNPIYDNAGSVNGSTTTGGMSVDAKWAVRRALR